MLGAAARASMRCRSALKVSRRWIRYTLGQMLARKRASSRAVLPPPTTAVSLPRKKLPSQVAQ